MKKRLFSLVLAVMFVLSLVPTAVFAEGTEYSDQPQMKFIVDSVKVGNDDTEVDIGIKLEGNSGFAGILYQLVYDSNVFELKEAPSVGNIAGMRIDSSGPVDTTPGKHMALIATTDGYNVMSDGTLATYTFSIKENAPAGSYEFRLITDGVADISGDNTVNLYVLDETFSKVEHSAISGYVTVPGYSVKYDAAGGSGAPASVTKSKNVDVVISRIIPVRDGYNFLGWSTTLDATAPEYKGGDKYTKNADVVLYAVWEKKPETVGTVKMAVETVEGKTGREVEVKVNLTENPAMHAMVFDVVYDEDVLEHISTEKGIHGSICLEHATKLNFQYMDLYTYGNTITETGTLLTLKFKVKENAPEGLTQITVAPSYGEFVKLVGENASTGILDVIVTSGGVAVSTQIDGDINLDDKVNSDDAVLLKKHFADGAAISYKGSLDFNGDGAETEDDAVALLRFALFPEEFSISEAGDIPETAKAVYTVENIEKTYQGDDVAVNVSLETASSFKAAGLANITYDKNVFTFNSAVISDDFGNLMYITDVSDMTFVSAAENELTSFNGTVLTLNFTVKSDAVPGNYEITGVPGFAGDDAMEAFVKPGVVTVKHIDEKPVVPAEKITLDNTTALVAVGNTVKLNVTFEPAEATDRALTWESSNESVATVDANGTVTAIAKGTAKITARTSNGKSATCSVTVGIPADAVEFTALKFTSLAVGKTMSFKAKAICSDKSKPHSANVTYEIVEGGEYATIDAKGKLTALAEGEVVVRATAQFGTDDAYADVTIRVCVPATKVTLNKTKASMALGYGDLELEAVLAPENHTDTLKWTVDKPEIAAVDENGVVTALTTGKVKVTAVAGSGKSASCTVTIGEPATAVELSALKTTSLAVGKNITLKGKAVRDDKVKPVSTAVVFEIIDGEEYATIDAKGKLTGLAIGEVTVRVKAEAGTEDAYEDVVINVCIPATKVTLNKTKASMALGYGELELEAIIAPENHTDTLTWSVDKPEIAAVDENGVVTALAAGKVKVTAMTGSGKKATCTVTIGEPATVIDISGIKATSVAPGKNITLKAKAGRDDKIKPVSTVVEYTIIEGENLATIDAKGKLVAGAEEGRVVVRAKVEAGDAYEDIVINICNPATKVTLNMTKATVTVGDELQLEATMTAKGECTDSLKWTSADETIATVDENGLVTVHSAGKVKITAMAGSGKSATCTVTVTE